jgi:hypothetical protein
VTVGLLRIQRQQRLVLLVLAQCLPMRVEVGLHLVRVAALESARCAVFILEEVGKLRRIDQVARAARRLIGGVAGGDVNALVVLPRIDQVGERHQRQRRGAHELAGIGIGAWRIADRAIAGQVARLELGPVDMLQIEVLRIVGRQPQLRRVRDQDLAHVVVALLAVRGGLFVEAAGLPGLRGDARSQCVGG